MVWVPRRQARAKREGWAGWLVRPSAPQGQGSPMADRIFRMVSSVLIRALHRGPMQGPGRSSCSA
jgi:hypothetical protein